MHVVRNNEQRIEMVEQNNVEKFAIESKLYLPLICSDSINEFDTRVKN